MKPHYDWNKSNSFDTSAFYYDVYRPGYPKELIKDIIDKTGITKDSKILEIGAGSGKATEQFVDEGFHIACVEPGENLVEVGLKKFQHTNQVTFFNSRFEELEVQKEQYDLVFSAQAFHWVPKPIGYQKSYEALREHQYLALFWNFYMETNSDIEKDLKVLFNTYSISYLESEEQLEQKVNQNVNEMEESNYFKRCDVLRYPWVEEYDAAEYLGFIKTWSGYLTLSKEDQQHILREIVGIFQKHGGRIQQQYQCVLFLTQKK